MHPEWSITLKKPNCGSLETMEARIATPTKTFILPLSPWKRRRNCLSQLWSVSPPIFSISTNCFQQLWVAVVWQASLLLCSFAKKWEREKVQFSRNANHGRPGWTSGQARSPVAVINTAIRSSQSSKIIQFLDALAFSIFEIFIVHKANSIQSCSVMSNDRCEELKLKFQMSQIQNM